MELNLLFLPLLGGYIFYTRWHVTAYFAARHSSQRLLFHAATAGLALLIVARTLVLTTDNLAGDSPGEAAEVAVFAVIGSAVAIQFALLFAWIDSRRIEDSEPWYRYAKSYAGIVLAAVSATAIYLLISSTREQWIGDPRRLIGTIAIVCLLVAGAAWCLARGTRHLDFHLDDVPLFLRAAILAMILSPLALIWAAMVDQIDPLWSGFSPYKDSGTAFLACLIGALAWWPLNLLFPYQVANARLHQNLKTGSLERLLYRAAIEAAWVQITLHDGKVYVGWIDRLPPDPSSTDAHVQMLPSMSGYRDPVTKKMTFTTYYDQFYDREGVDAYDFMKVLPTANIESAGRFLDEVYAEFLKEQRETTKPEAS